VSILREPDGARLHGDVVVYCDPDGFHYVASGDDGTWWRWPAIEHGWAQRRPCPASAVDACDELPATLARLALRLSGAPHDPD
jgi:hypothetical protein